MNSPRVELKDVWKRLQRRTEVTTLAELLYGLPRRLFQRPDEDGLRPHQFWALRNISFALEPGETLGIIGPNGAGKSSILKLLFRIFRPDRGSVRAQGRVTGLIELGAGFHPMLPARDNVFIYGSILGMSQREIRAKFDSIVEFAELPEFMDMPVKNYSSGMHARLSFAIAAHADPDVLLVDEVLAVGDASFQARCHDWIERRRKQGCSIVIVSHQMHVIQSATRCMYLNRGESLVIDAPRPVIDRYLRDQAERLQDSEAPASDRTGITHVEMLDERGEPIHELTAGTPVTLRVHWNFAEPVSGPVVTLDLLHDDPRYLISTPGGNLAQLSSGDALAGETAVGNGVFDVKIASLQLPIGQYRVNAAVKAHDAFIAAERCEDALRFEVRRPPDSASHALLELPQRWSIAQPTEAGAPPKP
ncbi:MAG: ABC transporter ATP-binding protein [Planctomycetes bacterium]|nr:ABC transporter ATP-binding protein [Planctomycetota bacterium]